MATTRVMFESTRVGRGFRNANQICVVGATISIEARAAATGRLQISLDLESRVECVGANGDEWVWREDRIRLLLDEEDADALFVSACVSNQVSSMTASIRSFS